MALFQTFVTIENNTQNAFYKVVTEESLNALSFLKINPNLPFNAAENRSGIRCSQREGGGWCQGVT